MPCEHCLRATLPCGYAGTVGDVNPSTVRTVFRTVAITYAEGPKYLELTRTPEHAETLAAILKPVSKDEK